MKRLLTRPLAILLGLGMLTGSFVLQAAFAAKSETKQEAERDPNYAQVVQQTAAMVGDAEAQQLAQKHGLQILNVTWEDTGRYKGSSVGPNISDMTIQV